MIISMVSITLTVSVNIKHLRYDAYHCTRMPTNPAAPMRTGITLLSGKDFKPAFRRTMISSEIYTTNQTTVYITKNEVPIKIKIFTPSPTSIDKDCNEFQFVSSKQNKWNSSEPWLLRPFVFQAQICSLFLLSASAVLISLRMQDRGHQPTMDTLVLIFWTL